MIVAVLKLFQPCWTGNFMSISRPPGFNWWFSFAPVFQWRCLTSLGSPSVLTRCINCHHLCFILGSICDLFVVLNDS